jgi:hypothetical protein
MLCFVLLLTAGHTPFAWLISHQPAVLFSQNKPATSNQPTVLFSQNKPAPAISNQPNEQAGMCLGLSMDEPRLIPGQPGVMCCTDASHVAL